MVFDQAQRGLKYNTPEAIHGSLLGYKELFLQGSAVSVPSVREFGRRVTVLIDCATYQFMQDRFQEVCDQILLYRDHRDAGVRRAVIELIPTLASYNPTEFTAHYLHKTMLYLLGQLKKDRDRTTGKHTPPSTLPPSV